MIADAILVKLSICPCGFPALDEAIPLGQAYVVDTASTDTFTWICGGCQKEQHDVPGIFVFKRGGSASGYLPAALLEVKGKHQAATPLYATPDKAARTNGPGPHPITGRGSSGRRARRKRRPAQS